MQPQSTRKARLLLALPILLFSGIIAHGQSSSDSGNPAFVTHSKGKENRIYIPNQERFYQFKIYKKDTSDNQYRLVTTITKSSSNSTSSPNSLLWTDKTSSTQHINYMVEAYNRNGSKICNMRVIWQCAK
jgi:hypothetical protein